MIHSDTVVIGSGLSGLVAALASASRGEKVTLLSYGAGTFPLNSGVIDILGYDAGHKPVASPAAAINRLPQTHPYQKVGLPLIQEAIEFFQEFMVRHNYEYSGDLTKVRWIPTAAGTMKPTCLTPSMMNVEALEDAERIVLVGVYGLKDYDVDLINRNLPDWLGHDKEYKVAMLETDREDGRDMTTLDVARWLDTDDGSRECLSQLKEYAGADTVFIMPQILGTDRSNIYMKISSGLGAAVIETTGLPPSPNGLRLRDILLEGLRQAGVDMENNTKVVGSVKEGGHAKAVIAASGTGRERRYYADKFILATGGFYSAGITMKNFGDAREMIFDLPIDMVDDYEAFANKELFSAKEQGFALAGVRTDNTLRAVDKSGKLVLDNVYVVGRNLSGYDYCHEHSGNGVALSTAYKAAMA